jgi:hypothetical protein
MGNAVPPLKGTRINVSRFSAGQLRQTGSGHRQEPVPWPVRYTDLPSSRHQCVPDAAHLIGNALGFVVPKGICTGLIRVIHVPDIEIDEQELATQYLGDTHTTVLNHYVRADEDTLRDSAKVGEPVRHRRTCPTAPQPR